MSSDISWQSWQSSDASPCGWQWDHDDQWSSWGQGWGNSQWSWNSATSWWSSGDWGSRPEDADEAKGTEAARVQALLKRGHTVDQLSTEDLQLLVRERETKQKKAAAPEAEASSVVQGETKVQAGDDKKEEEQEQEDKKESKEERRKRLHARNMRYYRSLESCLTASSIGEGVVN